MKHIALFLFLIILMPVSLISQDDVWPVKAVFKDGKTLPVNVYLEDGSAIPLSAIFEAGIDHFMDVKGIHNGEIIPIKLIASNDLLVPVKGISRDGNILNVKAVASSGKILDVKGVSRDGNTLNIAAISEAGKNIPLKAISPDGVERDVKGVKFLGENIEMEIGDIKIIAHVKALPTLDVGDVDSKWDIVVFNENKDKMKLIAISDKGREYPIKAEMDGSYPYLMNVKGQARNTIHIKLVKNRDGVVLTGIDEFGRLYDVRAVSENGESFKVFGGKTTGNVTPVYAVGTAGNKFPVKAISSKGHEFDVKGLKVKKGDREGTIGILEVKIKYYAHVKALAPAETIE